MLPSLPLGGANESTAAAAAASAANAAAHAAAAAVMNQPVASVQASTETMEQVILDPPGDDNTHMLTLSCLCCHSSCCHKQCSTIETLSQTRQCFRVCHGCNCPLEDKVHLDQAVRQQWAWFVGAASTAGHATAPGVTAINASPALASAATRTGSNCCIGCRCPRRWSIKQYHTSSGNFQSANTRDSSSSASAGCR